MLVTDKEVKHALESARNILIADVRDWLNIELDYILPDDFIVKRITERDVEKVIDGSSLDRFSLGNDSIVVSGRYEGEPVNVFISQYGNVKYVPKGSDTFIDLGEVDTKKIIGSAYNDAAKTFLTSIGSVTLWSMVQALQHFGFNAKAIKRIPHKEQLRPLLWDRPPASKLHKAIITVNTKLAYKAAKDAKLGPYTISVDGTKVELYVMPFKSALEFTGKYSKLGVVKADLKDITDVFDVIVNG